METLPEDVSSIRPAGLTIGEAVAKRRSCRAFLAKPVPMEMVLDIIVRASRAPSGVNLQPWQIHVLHSEKRDALVRRVHELAPEQMLGEGPDYALHPEMTPTEKARHEGVSAVMYAAAGVDRHDVQSRFAHRLRNWSFFGAPVGLIFTIERRMQPGQWADVGMFAQNIMLLALEHGLETCAQESWALWPDLIRDHLGLGEEHMVYAGMAIGYADLDHPINGFRTERAEPAEFITVHR